MHRIFFLVSLFLAGCSSVQLVSEGELLELAKRHDSITESKYIGSTENGVCIEQVKLDKARVYCTPSAEINIETQKQIQGVIYKREQAMEEWREKNS